MASADWYPDPSNLHEYRYWDGAAWTENVADNGVGSTAAVDATLPPPAIIPAYQPAAAVPTTPATTGPGSPATKRWLIGGAIGVVLIVVVVLLATSGGGNGNKSSSAGSSQDLAGNPAAQSNSNVRDNQGLCDNYSFDDGGACYKLVDCVGADTDLGNPPSLMSAVGQAIADGAPFSGTLTDPITQETVDAPPKVIACLKQVIGS